MLRIMKRYFYLASPVLVIFFSLFCRNAGTGTNIASATAENDSSVRPIQAIAYIRNGLEIRLIDSNGLASGRVRNFIFNF